MVDINMTNIFRMMGGLFNTLVATAQLLWVWMSEPIDSELAYYLGIPASTTNLELVFGSVLIMVIVFGAVKFFTGLFPGS